MDLPPSRFHFNIANGELKILLPKQIISFDREYKLAVKKVTFLYDEKLVTKPFAVSTGGIKLLCLILMTVIGCLKN